jgi:L-alanine-DL-glutamate epimerase-like enolase superfamily enzyme
MSRSPGARVEAVHALAHTVPTEVPESDGTFEWDRTTLMLALATSEETTGIGYIYGDAEVAHLVDNVLTPVVVGCGATAPAAAWEKAARRTQRRAGRADGTSHFRGRHRPVGPRGTTSRRAPGVPVRRVPHRLPGLRKRRVHLLPPARFRAQLAGWVDAGFTAVKIKAGRDQGEDDVRVGAARATLGPEATLMVDANGAYTPAEAVQRAHVFADHGVSWLEEPVTSDDVDGLRFVRDHAPAGMLVAAGEYAFHPWTARQLLQARAVDVLQLDPTRCLGYTGLLMAADAAAAAHVPISTHTAPQLHVHVHAGVRDLQSLEWFHDHERIENLLFAGTALPCEDRAGVDLTQPGNGLTRRDTTAKRAA